MGLVSVRGLAAAPMVPVVTPPLFRPLRLLCPLLLHFVCSGSYYPLPIFRIQSSQLLLPVFLYVFPWTEAPAAPSRLPPCFYACYCSGCFSQSSSAFSTDCGCGCSLRFVVRLLLLCLLRIFRVRFPSIPVFCASRSFYYLCLGYSFFLSGPSQVSFLFHHFVSLGCVLSLSVSSSSSFVGGFLCSGFCSSSAGVTFLSLSVLIAFYGDSASFGSPVSFVTWSPFGTSQVLLRPLFLSCQGCFWWSFPFLCGFPFCSSDSFASKVPLATWSPSGMSPTSFGVLSLFWFLVIS